jgi:hypothetical protein
MFTAQCALSPYIKQIRFVFKGLIVKYVGLAWDYPNSELLQTLKCPSTIRVTRILVTVSYATLVGLIRFLQKHMSKLHNVHSNVRNFSSHLSNLRSYEI